MSGEIPRVDVPRVELSGGDAAVEPTLEFDDFYRSTRARVAGALVATLRDADLANDSIDEAFVKAYQRWDRVCHYDNPGGWIYRVALNHATSRIRQIRRRAARLLEVGSEVRGATQTPSVEHVEHRYADPAVGAALAELSIGQRSVVVCRLLLGWSEKDTAAALDIRPGTVKSRLSRALEQLESRLSDLRPEES